MTLQCLNIGEVAHDYQPVLGNPATGTRTHIGTS